jgi:hypothetical protein
MFSRNQKFILITVIILIGILLFTTIYTPPSINSTSGVDKITDYLYSVPIIIKRAKSFFSFSELPIFEVLRKKNLTNLANNSIVNTKPQIQPTPTGIPITAKPKIKSINKIKAGNENTNTPNHPKFTFDIIDNKTTEELLKNTPEIVIPTATSATPNTTDSVEQDINDWKYRLFVNPSKDNMNQFIQQYQSGKITKNVFYSVLKSLLNESDDRSQAIAIYGLSAVMSYESYEILALKIDEKSLKKDNQALAQKNLDYYSSAENLRYLVIALRSSQQAINLQALHSIFQLVESKQTNNIQSQNITSENARQKRGSSSTLIKKDSYIEVVGALKGLTANSNSQVAILAENTLQQFQETISPRPNFEATNTQTASRVR